MARQHFDWSKLGGASKYDEANGSDHWLLDTVERARRVYARWVCHMVEGKVPHFSFAVRLLALMQPSSCAVERVFSQVKLIVEQTGSRSLEDLFLLRVFMRCNGSVHDQFGLVR